MSDFYKNEKIEEVDKRNAAFQTANAIREAVSLAQKKPQPITYEKAFNYIHDLAPDKYQAITDLLSTKNESDKVKLYKDLADYENAKGNPVSPIDLIEAEISKLEEIIGTAENNTGLRNELTKLIVAKEYFLPRTVSEHKILNHDFYLAERPYFKNKIYENDSYKDYRLSERECLRLRLLHPDKAEAILGADLIYEQFDLLKDRVRFVHLQYKAWNTQVLYLNDDRLKNQISKMSSHLCGAGLCHGTHGKNHTKKYRFPYCSAFIRPTSNKTSENSKLISTGYHLPICEASRLLESEGKATKENLKGKSLSNTIFEEGFSSNILGSRWIPISDLDKFYKTAGVNLISSTIRIHAQEVYIPTDEEISNQKK